MGFENKLKREYASKVLLSNKHILRKVYIVFYNEAYSL